jgi:N-acetylglucosamine kinase-like BadF-type ATPase
MKLIAESGSSSTDWRIIDNSNNAIGFETKGINPLFLDAAQLIKELHESFPKNISTEDITELTFYGPGCSTTERCNIVKNPLSKVFNKATIEVNSDLLAAARALFGKQNGIACILGTGSNSGYYDGNKIISNIPSTGYILGDEGSGANLGLRFIKAYLNQQIEKELSEAFENQFQLKISDIIDKVYREAYPNRFLANFAPFINKNLHYNSVYDICRNSFSEFIDWHILPYENSLECEISVVGSIAEYFKVPLQEIAKNKGFQFSKIVAKPIDSLYQMRT